jgi:hypothetical protein
MKKGLFSGKLDRIAPQKQQRDRGDYDVVQILSKDFFHGLT